MQTTPVATTAPHKSKPVTEKERNGTSVNEALGTKKMKVDFLPPVWLLKKNRNKLNAKVGGKNGNEKNSVSKTADSH